MANHLDAFITHMWATALWSSYEGDEALDAKHGPEDIAPKTRVRIETDAKAFYEAHAALIHADDAPSANHFDGTTEERQAAMAGHDFWLTRCGHGAGFWDGDWPDEGRVLTAACEKYGNVDLYVGDDGLIHG